MVNSLVKKMKKVRQIFCKLTERIQKDNIFIPKGTIVQIVQMVEVEGVGNLTKEVMVKVSDYIDCDVFQKQPSRLCGHATSGEPVLITVSPIYLEYHSTKILNVE